MEIIKKRTRKNLRRLGGYVSCFAAYLLPNGLLRWRMQRMMSSLSQEQKAEVERRADYYCRLPEGCRVGESAKEQARIRRNLATKTNPKDVSDTTSVGDFTYPWRRKHKFTLFFFDLYHIVRLFPKHLRLNYFFGDIAEELPEPTLAKSRPAAMKDSMTVLYKLNSFRHFDFPTDMTSFDEKKDALVFRNIVNKQPWRTSFIHKWSGHPLCDVGQVNADSDVGAKYLRPFMSMEEQLKFKFIVCIEGHDVATNLKWVMASNSVAVMPKPRMESWFMEASLIPDYHYIEVKSDYSDVEEKLLYYIAHPDEAKAIIHNAHEFIAQFQDKKMEKCVQYSVVRRYFEQTMQTF